MDFLRPHGEVLLECYEEPAVIHHPKGHTVPRLCKYNSWLNYFNNFIKCRHDYTKFNSIFLWIWYFLVDDKSMSMMTSFLKRIEQEVIESSDLFV